MALRLFFNSARNPFIRNGFFNQSLRGFPSAFSDNREALKINSISSRRFAYFEAAAWKNTGFFNQLPSRLSNPQKRDFCSIAGLEKKPTFEEFKKINSFEKFQEADIVEQLVDDPFLVIKDWLYKDFCEIEYSKLKEGDLQDILSNLKPIGPLKKYPILQKGERVQSFWEFKEKELLSFEEFKETDFIKSLIEYQPQRYDDEMLEGFYLTYCSRKHSDYEIQVGYWKNKISFEEYKELYIESFEEFKDGYLYRDFSEEEKKQVYKNWCESEYQRYGSSLKYGPYHNPSRMI